MSQKGEIDRYIEYLGKEARLIYETNKKKKIQVNTIFIGGGTPNLLSKEQYKNLYFVIKEYFELTDLEQFLIDGHPNYYTPEKIDYLKSI
jgi:oxygen-independent coproporphyrinogen-3 oxidase